MAVQGGNNLGILDVIKTQTESGEMIPIVEILNENNAVLDDVQWKEGNLVEGNRTVQRTSLPAVTARTVNVGVTPTASGSAQINDACAIFETQSVLDRHVAEVGGNVAANRANEARAHIEALGQKFVDTLFYGTLATPNEFQGLANRYALTTGVNGDNIISLAGTGSDQTSIWFVQWGMNRVMGIYPKGTPAGLQRLDEGLTSIVDGTGVAGATFPGYREYFTWRCGLAVMDWRCVVRICNIDVPDLQANSSPPNLIDAMIQAIETVPNPDAGGVFYMNRATKKMLRIQAKDAVQTGGQLGYADIAGRRVLTFDGYAVRTVDRIDNTETAVS